ncbi:MAG: ATP-binding protein [Planctomycetes bacterium]|nr:ATP-binding protein [Planctomycetota bacterium]
MDDRQPTTGTTLIFIVEKNADEREAMRSAIADSGYLALPVDSTAAAITMLTNGAACDLIIYSADTVEGTSLEEFDAMLTVRDPSPRVIVYGMDREAKFVLHCLNKGACDFLPKPFSREELVHAIENSIVRDGSGPTDTIVASSPITGWIELTASSELEQFRRLQRFSDALFASRLPATICEDLKMAVEEVGRNAVEWGNRFDPDKQVHISYCIFDDRVVIKVEDEGDGFAPKSIPDPTADPMKTMQDRIDAGKRPGGYGVYLIQRLVDDIVYNEKGNTVLLIKYLPEGGILADGGPLVEKA